MHSYYDRPIIRKGALSHVTRAMHCFSALFNTKLEENAFSLTLSHFEKISLICKFVA